MTKEQLLLLREWIRAEIEYGIYSKQEGSDGYYQSAKREEKKAERLFEEVLKGLESEKKPLNWGFLAK